MLIEPTIEKLYALKLGSMAVAFLEQQKTAKIGDEPLADAVCAIWARMVRRRGTLRRRRPP